MNARTEPDLTVTKSVTVQAPQAVAFEVFTARMASWWPMASHHVGEADCADVVIEPRVGGEVVIGLGTGRRGAESCCGHRLDRVASREMLSVVHVRLFIE